jgi:hypothetical protein
MSFLSNREHMILMDIPLESGRSLTLDDLKALRDAGIETAWLYGMKMDAPLSVIDDRLNQYRQAGLKCLLPLWHKQTATCPASWYLQTRDGRRVDILSPWNTEAMALYNDSLLKMRDAYTADDCQVVSCWITDGETVLIDQPAYYDQAALASHAREVGGYPLPDAYNHPEGTCWLKQTYTRILVEQQRILMDTPWREIWYMLHRMIATYPDSHCDGCDYIDDYLTAFTELKPASINHISYTYFPHGPNYWRMIDRDRERWHINEWVGAEYAEGLRDGNGELAARQGLRGLFIGPTHPYTHHGGIEPWMLAEIKKAAGLWD